MNPTNPTPEPDQDRRRAEIEAYIDRYRPDTLAAEVADQVLPRLKELVRLAAPSSREDAKYLLCAGCRLIADHRRAAGEIDVDAVICEIEVAAWSHGAKRAGMSPGTLANYLRCLNRARAANGMELKAPATRKSTRRIQLLDRDRLQRLAQRLVVEDPPAAVALVVAAGAGLLATSEPVTIDGSDQPTARQGDLVVPPTKGDIRWPPVNKTEAKRATFTKAEAKRLAAAKREAARRQPTLPDHLQALLDHYEPRRVDGRTWETVRSVHHDVMVRSEILGQDSFTKACTDLAAYLAWRHETDLPVTLEEAMTFAAIDDYHRRGDRGGLNDRSWDERRSKLRGLARKANPGPNAPTQVATVGHQSVKPPYTLREEFVLRRVALRQRTATARRQMCALVGLCAGAGLDPTDLRELRRRDIVDHGDDGIRVDVPGKRSRTVWVRRDYEQLVRVGIDGLANHDLVIGTKASRRVGVP